MNDFIYAILAGDDIPDDCSLTSIFWPGPFSTTTISSLPIELLKTPFWPVLLPTLLENKNELTMEEWLKLHSQANRTKEKVDVESDKKEEQKEKASDKKTSKQSTPADIDLAVRLKHELDHVNGVVGELLRVELANLSKQKDERLFDEAEHGLVTGMRHVLAGYQKLIEAFLEHNNLKHSK